MKINKGEGVMVKRFSKTFLLCAIALMAVTGIFVACQDSAYAAKTQTKKTESKNVQSGVVIDTSIIDMTVASDNKIYAVRKTGEILQLDSEDKPTVAYAMEDVNAASFSAICSYKKGLLVADAVSGGSIGYYTIGKAYKTLISTACSINTVSITVDNKNNIYTLDGVTGKIVKFSADGKSKKVFKLTPGTKKTNVKLGTPGAILWADNKLYIADSENNRIMAADSKGKCVCVAGTGKEGYKDAVGTKAQFACPVDMSYLSGKIYISDLNNGCIRVLETKTGKVSTLMNPYTIEGGLYPVAPNSIVATKKKIYFSDFFTIEN